MIINYYDHTYDVDITLSRVADELIIWLYDKNDGSFIDSLTMNLGRYSHEYGLLNTSHIPDAERFVDENRLGYFTGHYMVCGRNTWPEYRFDMKRLCEIAIK